ncbi:MAG: hypothetical protein ABW133_19305, partial [Polyangiaceae bacterium]
MIRKVRRLGGAWRAVFAILVCVIAALFAYPASALDASGNLLAGLSPSSVRRVRRPQLLTDGRAAPPGGYWKSTITSQLDNLESFVVYDLGSEQKISAVWLQADSNDVY